MKKQLLNLCLLLLTAGTVFSQTNKQTTLATRIASAFSTGQTTFKNTLLLPVPTTTTSTCMSYNYPTPTTWSLVNYYAGTQAGGFANGMNLDLDKEKAMYYDVSASANTMITQMYVGFGVAYSATPSKTVAIRVYDGTSGAVGATIGSGTITMGEIMTDVTANRYSVVFFPTPLNLPASKKFFVGVDLTGLQWTTSIKDSLSIVSNTNGQTTPSPVWEKWSNNTWHQYTSAGSYSLNISLLIHPFLTQAPIVATFSATSGVICAGKSITYNATGSTTGGAYQWNFGAIPTPTAGTYTTLLIVSDACGSLGAAQGIFTVNANPVVTATPSSTTVCSGRSVTLSGNGANTYAWTGSVNNGVAFVPSVSTNYTVTGTATNGCTNTAVASVVVNTLPAVTASPSATTICSGSSIVLNGGGANTYVWTGSVNNGVSFTPVSSTNYTVTGTAVNGCTNTAVAAVVVNTTPVVTINSSTTTLCAGGNVTLSGNGATTYTWTGGVNNAVAFVPPATNIYTVTGSTGNCTNTATVGITVNPLPVVTANPSSVTACNGSSITLTGNGATSYNWTGGVNNGVAFAPSVSGNYTVTGIGANGCSATAVATVVVVAALNVTANASSALICSGSNVTLTGGGATSYIWTGGVTNGTPFTPSSTDTYTVTGTAGSCSNTAVVTVSVTNSPAVLANTSLASVCAGTSVILTGNGATTYVWSNSVTDGVSFVPSSTTTYTVTGSVGSCSNTAVVTVTVNPIPVVTANATSTVICNGSNVTLTGGGATTYVWSGGVTDGTSFVPLATNTYTVSGSSAGCTGTASVQVVVNTCTGLASLSAQNQNVVIFPNPNNGEFTIKANSEEQISLTNELGQLIQIIELNQFNHFSYTIQHLAGGVYFLTGTSTKQKVVVTR